MYSYEKDPESGLYYAGARYYNPKMGSFNSTDELWHLSPDKTSYHYCSNNPIMFVDPDGRDPIYAKKFWGGVRKIGDDGKCGSGSYLVRGSVAREVKKATKAGEFYTGDLSQSNNVMHIPTGALLDAVIQSVQETERSKRENGGHQNFGESVIRWDEGRDPYITIENGVKRLVSEVDVFVVNGESVMCDPSKMKIWWHVHNDVELDGIFSSTKVSPADFNIQKDMKSMGYKGNSFIVGIDGKNKIVRFFNDKRELVVIKYLDFLKMGKNEE